jgi:hypothetical protein
MFQKKTNVGSLITYTWLVLDHLFAEGAYDRTQLMDKAAFRDFTIQIVKRSDTAKGFAVLPRRWVVERTFGWMTRWRRLAPTRGQRGIFPKEHAKGVSAIGHGFPLPKPLIFSFGGLGGRLAEQVARDVDQREPPPFFGQFGGVGLDEYLDGLVAGINFDTQRAALEIDFVTPSRFTANNCMGHLRSYERLKG